MVSMVENGGRRNWPVWEGIHRQQTYTHTAQETDREAARRFQLQPPINTWRHTFQLSKRIRWSAVTQQLERKKKYPRAPSANTPHRRLVLSGTLGLGVDAAEISSWRNPPFGGYSRGEGGGFKPLSSRLWALSFWIPYRRLHGASPCILCGTISVHDHISSHSRCRRLGCNAVQNFANFTRFRWFHQTRSAGMKPNRGWFTVFVCKCHTGSYTWPYVGYFLKVQPAEN